MSPRQRRPCAGPCGGGSLSNSGCRAAHAASHVNLTLHASGRFAAVYWVVTASVTRVVSTASLIRGSVGGQQATRRQILRRAAGDVGVDNGPRLCQESVEVAVASNPCHCPIEVYRSRDQIVLLVANQTGLLLVAGHLFLWGTPVADEFQDVFKVLENSRLIVASRFLLYNLLHLAVMFFLIVAPFKRGLAVVTPSVTLDIRQVRLCARTGDAFGPAIRV